MNILFFTKEGHKETKPIKFSHRGPSPEKELFDYLEEQTVCRNERLWPKKEHKHFPPALKIRALVRRLTMLGERYSSLMEIFHTRVDKINDRLVSHIEGMSSPQLQGTGKLTILNKYDLSNQIVKGRSAILGGVYRGAKKRSSRELSAVEIVRIQKLLKNCAIKDDVYSSLLDKFNTYPISIAPGRLHVSRYKAFQSFREKKSDSPETLGRMHNKDMATLLESKKGMELQGWDIEEKKLTKDTKRGEFSQKKRLTS